MRPGCDRPAEVRLSYDTVSCQVWLDPILDRPGPVQEICEFHALRLTVPRGWLLCERRVANPALFVPADAPEKAVPPSVPSGASTGGDRSSSTVPPAVPLTVGAPSPRVGRRSIHRDTVQPKRRHPSETARELFPDDLAQPVEPAQPVALVDPPAPAAPTESDGPVVTVGPAERAAAVEVGSSVPAGASVPADSASDALDVPTGAAGTEEEAGDLARAAEPEEGDDGKDTLKPTSPLLARAFAQTGPQRSVLSDDLRVPDQERRRRNSR